MGGNSSKSIRKPEKFKLTKEEHEIVRNSFKIASNQSDKIKKEDLMQLWSSQVDASIFKHINNYLFNSGENTVHFDRYAELYVFCTRGTVDERLHVLLHSIELPSSSKEDLPFKSVYEFIESLVSTYMKIQKIVGSAQVRSWISRGCVIHMDNVHRLAESQTHSLGEGGLITPYNLSTWINNSYSTRLFLKYVFTHLYHFTEKPSEKPEKPIKLIGEQNEEDKDHGLVPFCRGLHMSYYPSVLDLTQIVFINKKLPKENQYEWRFLFSSAIHGNSFAILVSRIVKQGASVLIVQDEHGYIFGGYASYSWNVGPKWIGDSGSFLFTLSPKMRIYTSTGYNDHFMYLNLFQKTMPNGLAMGGQLTYCGIWLDAEYGHGHTSETCTTYKQYKQMSAEKNFTHRHLEVWGVGPVPDVVDEVGPTVVMGHQEAKALLNMAGKTIHHHE